MIGSRANEKVEGLGYKAKIIDLDTDALIGVISVMLKLCSGLLAHKHNFFR